MADYNELVMASIAFLLVLGRWQLKEHLIMLFSIKCVTESIICNIRSKTGDTIPLINIFNVGIKPVKSLFH